MQEYLAASDSSSSDARCDVWLQKTSGLLAWQDYGCDELALVSTLHLALHLRHYLPPRVSFDLAEPAVLDLPLW